MNHRKGHKNTCIPNRDRGSALVVTLLIIATLTGLAVAFSDDSSTELSLAGFSRDGYRAYLTARSGVHFAMALLDNEENKEMDSYREDWAKFEMAPVLSELSQDVTFTGKIVDENGKFNLNSLVNEKGEIVDLAYLQLLRLFSTLGIDEKLIPPLLDWLDKDDIERLDGAENYYYQNRQGPYPCANGPFLTIGQVFLVKGFREVEKFGEKGKKRLLDFMTISSDGKININTAPREVLQSLSDKLDGAVADGIIEYRQEEDFFRIDDLKKVTGISDEVFNEIKDRITVKSSAFSIEAQGHCQEAEAHINAIVKRESGRLKLVYWRVI